MFWTETVSRCRAGNFAWEVTRADDELWLGREREEKSPEILRSPSNTSIKTLETGGW